LKRGARKKGKRPEPIIDRLARRIGETRKWKDNDTIAASLLAVMYEPSEAMVNEVTATVGGSREVIKSVWHRMITAALTEHSAGS
jgi:hypothetical protein